MRSSYLLEVKIPGLVPLRVFKSEMITVRVITVLLAEKDTIGITWFSSENNSRHAHKKGGSGTF